jgi:hypothetical protein
MQASKVDKHPQGLGLHTLCKELAVLEKAACTRSVTRDKKHVPASHSSHNSGHHRGGMRSVMHTSKSVL